MSKIWLAAGPLLMTLTFSIATPAAATDLGQAVKMCDANPNCVLLPPKNATGMQMVVKTSQGDKIVDCPSKGPCTASRKNPPGGAGAGKGGKAGATALLQSASARSVGPATKSGASTVDRNARVQNAVDRRSAPNAPNMSNNKGGGSGKRR